ncbi:hypothetical protein [uncultured Thiohalocapsa sp.]|uniref:hypothetical protein n=1 Tax=uncultured Thiohalocapsa sp. TaxID=768990 RepID=UPI0025FD6E20|nr:hypothetical protein [uncultured Thiohalocapsa sp.]
MSALRIFQITLLLVLWYFLAGLVFSRWLGVWPQAYEQEGFFLIAAAMPWALLALDFHAPTTSAVGAAVRDSLFLLLLGLGIAVNAAILNALLAGAARRIAVEHALRRNVAAAWRRRG